MEHDSAPPVQQPSAHQDDAVENNVPAGPQGVQNAAAAETRGESGTQLLSRTTIWCDHRLGAHVVMGNLRPWTSPVDMCKHGSCA